MQCACGISPADDSHAVDARRHQTEQCYEHVGSLLHLLGCHHSRLRARRLQQRLLGKPHCSCDSSTASVTSWCCVAASRGDAASRKLLTGCTSTRSAGCAVRATLGRLSLYNIRCAHHYMGATRNLQLVQRALFPGSLSSSTESVLWLHRYARTTRGQSATMTSRPWRTITWRRQSGSPSWRSIVMFL